VDIPGSIDLRYHADQRAWCDTENLVRSENTGVPIIREIMVATTMSSLFVAGFALLASTFRTRAALQAEILALRHQLAVFQRTHRVACASTAAGLRLQFYRVG
jgi:hypothetical protein